MKTFISSIAFIVSVFWISPEAKAQIQVESTNVTPAIDSVAYFSPENFLGTFQIIHQSKDREIFTHDLYYEIEARRHDTEVILWMVSDLTIIRIFPRNLIMPPMNYRISEQEIISADKFKL